MSKAIETIYIAGKMNDDSWRRDLFDETGYESSHPHKCNPVISFDTSFNDEPWPKSSDVTVCGLRYTGPFFVDTLGGHGFSCFEGDEHGGNARYSEDSAKRVIRRQEVQQLCLQAITRADLVLAWIDCIDCYGTIAEIGYAKALEKTIWIVGPRSYNDLWFVYHMGDEVSFLYGRRSLKETFQDLLDKHRRYYPRFDSPIEQAFWDAWMHADLPSEFDLIPQYPIGKYRVDFAHIPTRTVIELDGHATHSSPDAIAYDRKRQREIEEQGWHVIRFGGKEIYLDAGKCGMEAFHRILDRSTPGGVQK